MFQPTPEDPAIVLMVDEVDEVVASVPGSGAILEFLASKQRKSAVCLILATQRATQKQTGGGMVRANLSQVVIGNTNRATESRHATGAEAEIPDISEYSRGRKGYFQIWDPQAKEITARGRTFLLGVPPDELAYCKRIVDARKGTRRVLPAVDLAVHDRQEHAPERGSTGRQRDAGEAGGGQGRQREDASRRQQVRPRCPPRGCPRTSPAADAQVLLALLALAGGHHGSGRQARRSGSRRRSAYEYLNVLRDHGIAELVTAGRSSRYRLAGRPRAAAGSRA